MSLTRYGYELSPVTIASNVTNSTPVEFHRFSAMIIVPPSDWTTANVTFYQQSPLDGNYYILKRSDDTLIQQSVGPSFAQECPCELFAATNIKMTSASAANDDKPVTVVVKG